MSASHCSNPAFETLNKFRIRFGASQSLVSNCLHDRERILDPMAQLAQQQFLLLLPLLALGNVTSTFENQPMTFDCDQLEPAVDCKLASIFGPLYQFAAPAPTLAQRRLDLLERRTRHG